MYTITTVVLLMLLILSSASEFNYTFDIKCEQLDEIDPYNACILGCVANSSNSLIFPIEVYNLRTSHGTRHAKFRIKWSSGILNFTLGVIVQRKFAELKYQVWNCTDIHTISNRIIPKTHLFDVSVLAAGNWSDISRIRGGFYLGDSIEFTCPIGYYGQVVYWSDRPQRLFECHGNYSQVFRQELTTNSGNLETTPVYEGGTNVTYVICTTSNLRDAVYQQNCNYTRSIFYLNYSRDTKVGRAYMPKDDVLRRKNISPTITSNQTARNDTSSNDTEIILKMGCTFERWRNRCILACACAYNLYEGAELNWTTEPHTDLAYWKYDTRDGVAVASNSYVFDDYLVVTCTYGNESANSGVYECGDNSNYSAPVYSSGSSAIHDRYVTSLNLFSVTVLAWTFGVSSKFMNIICFYFTIICILYILIE